MKVELENLRLGISAFGDKCQIGILDPKRPNVWKHKQEIHNDFIHAVITCWKGKKEVVSQDEQDFEYVISVVKRKKKSRKKVKK